MILRDATPSDAASLAALSIEVCVGTYLRRGVGAVFADCVLGTYTPERMRALIADPGQIVLVSCNEEGPDGYVRIASEAAAPLPACRGAEIATLYVQPRHHGRGIGRALLDEAFARCRARGIDAAWLTTNAENAPALGFYRRIGFRIVGRTDFVIDGAGYPNEVLVLATWRPYEATRMRQSPPRALLVRPVRAQAALCYGIEVTAPHAIDTPRLILRPPRLSEVPDLFAFLGDAAAMRHTHCDPSLRDCRRRIAMHEWRRRHDGYAPWTVRARDTGRIVGWGGLYDDPFDPGWGIELAYYFAPSVWGRGYATELGRAALAFADEQLAAPRITAFAHPENAASNALLTRLGFSYERFVEGMQRNLYRRHRPV